MQRTAAPLLLGCLSVLTAPPPSRCSVLLHPPQLLVRFGGSLNVTCRSSCPSPPSGGGVETSSLYEARPLGASTLHVELLNVSEWRSSVQCYFRCGGSREARKAELRAYRPLDNPELSPIPPLRSGRPYNLSCFVPKVSPISNLTLALLLDNLTLHTATFWGRPQEEPEDVLVTHEVTPRREDHGRSATCRAVLDLQPYGPLYDSVSTARLLEVYDFPDPPTLLTTPPTSPKTPILYLETGQELNLTCKAPNAFPEANISLWMDGEGLQPQQKGVDGSLGVAGLFWDRPGKHRLRCRVKVGPEEKSRELRVNVYDLPPPQLNVSTADPVAMQNVSGFCRLPGGGGDDEGGGETELRLLLGREVLVPWGGSPLLFTLPVNEKDDGKELRCHARMEGGAGKWSRAVRLNVSAPPYMDDQLCPPTRTWTEGQQVALWCIARGKPEPEVRCHKEGSGDVLVQRPGTVRREHSGTYRCQASNSLGTAERGVSVRVEYWEVNVGLWVALSVAAAVGAAAGLVAYRLYYRKKKIRHYELQKKQQQRLMDLEGRAEGAESAPNGSAPGVQA